jgi:hypothetical protein
LGCLAWTCARAASARSRAELPEQRLSRFAANGSAEVSEPDDRTRPDQIKVLELLGRNLAVQADQVDLGLMEVPGDP